MTLKQRLQNLFFPLGSIQRIRSGYLKGFRIRVTQNSGWSPLRGNWEPAMQKIMANVITPGQVVYDLGANNGLHGLLMAALVGDKGLVVNFEPLPENITEIDDNFRINNLSHYKNVRAAVSDKEGVAHFVVSGHHKQGFLSEGHDAGEKSVEVPVTTLDKFIADGNPGPAFMKVDIEGAEGPALHGFSAMVGKYNPCMIIELHNPEQDRIVGRFLAEHGYTAYRFEPFEKLRFTEITDLSEQTDSMGIWGTIFCLPPGRKLAEFKFDK